MSETLYIYTDACMSSKSEDKRGFASFLAMTETTHVMSRVFSVETDNIYIAEKEAALRAISEIENDDYSSVEIYMDNKAAVFTISDAIKENKPPFNKFNNIKVIKVEAHQNNNNPNKVADLLAAAGRSLFYYDNGLQPRAMYRLQYPSRVAENSTVTSNGKIQKDT